MMWKSLIDIIRPQKVLEEVAAKKAWYKSILSSSLEAYLDFASFYQICTILDLDVTLREARKSDPYFEVGLKSDNRDIEREELLLMRIFMDKINIVSYEGELEELVNVVKQNSNDIFIKRVSDKKPVRKKLTRKDGRKYKIENQSKNLEGNDENAIKNLQFRSLGDNLSTKKEIDPVEKVKINNLIWVENTPPLPFSRKIRYNYYYFYKKKKNVAARTLGFKVVKIYMTPYSGRMVLCIHKKAKYLLPEYIIKELGVDKVGDYYNLPKEKIGFVATNKDGIQRVAIKTPKVAHSILSCLEYDIKQGVTYDRIQQLIKLHGIVLEERESNGFGNFLYLGTGKQYSEKKYYKFYPGNSVKPLVNGGDLLEFVQNNKERIVFKTFEKGTKTYHRFYLKKVKVMIKEKAKSALDK